MDTQLLISLMGLGILATSTIAAVVGAAILVARMFGLTLPACFVDILIYAVLSRAALEYFVKRTFNRAEE